MYRFARGIKGKNISTRTRSSSASWFLVDMFRLNLRAYLYTGGSSLLNGRVNRVPNITSYRAFQGGDVRVKISLKQYMDSAKWNGIYGNGDVHPDAPPHDHFIAHPLSVKDVPTYNLKHVRWSGIIWHRTSV